ncbi:hypothetical protein GSI_03358 [Ganoderma sinense ZZ0214-1]|uniref:Prenyltransferase alpha-alpha toroid domain-containing protein n=1 Tax=Ganoderma sinense ZZ0214-1 TaxID=1077348 RepID=A0A2G8SLF3_9APHY|nr:hypothetical protein GSI_03358 [Ganoderma sinense ZZ0214-1]
MAATPTIGFSPTSTPTDGYRTATSVLQSATETTIKSHRESATEAQLQRRSHFDFLLRNLRQGFPERYISQDASQPWLIYWTLHGFSILGAGLDDQTKKRTIETLLALQHPEGGFGGGPDQAAHLLATYAAVSAFAVVGRPGDGGGWDAIDRGIYCLLVVATLLNILTPELLAGLPQFLATCQTYEGGFCNASFPGWAFGSDDTETSTPSPRPSDPSAPRPVLGEAHGGYTFCAAASWVLLQPYIESYCSPAPGSQLPEPKIDARALLRWCVQMQGLPIELGGFKGRTNKLVDGCYSWWVGGCVVLVESLLGVAGAHDAVDAEMPNENDEDGAKGWDDVDESLFDRRALQEYILYAGQHPAGGLRDKPPKPADAYHTLYCATGLSAAQHRVTPSEARRKAVMSAWDPVQARARGDTTTYVPPSDVERERFEEVKKQTFAHALSWSEEEGAETYVGGAANRVNAAHPVFNLTFTHADGMLAHFYGQTPPLRYPLHAKK